MTDRSLLVLLLPCRLEDFGRRELAESLMASADAVAVEPGTVSLTRLARVSRGVTAGLAGMQARRMRLPGTPRAVALFDPAQYPLARALIAANPGAELWYGPGEGAAGDEHELAAARAALRFEESASGRATLAAGVRRVGVERA